jgi:hypothetical protein
LRSPIEGIQSPYYGNFFDRLWSKELMSIIRAFRFTVFAAAFALTVSQAIATVVINEFVKEERTGGAGAVTPDTREYIELFNSGAADVDISNWTLSTYRLSGTAAALPGTYFFTDTINPGTVLHPGQFFVMGTLANVTVSAGALTQDLGAGELYEDLRATVMELRRGPVDSAPIEDAVGYDMFFASNTPPAGVTFQQPTPDQAAQISNGIWGQVQSYNIPETTDFKRLSMSRYRDGVDTNTSGRDFGYLPMTPGSTNNTLPQVPAHTVPNVEALAPGTAVSQYNYAFVPARVVDVTQAGPLGADPDGAAGPLPQQPINPKIISAPPTGNKAVVMWDETGGGNAIYSKELNNKFNIYAYLDTSPLNLPGDWQGEWTAYGIGTTDPLFGTPNPNAFVLGTSSANTNTQNGSTGVGWLYQRFQERPDEGGDNHFVLSLVNFGQGGNSVLTSPNAKWQVIESFDLTAADTGWTHLGIDYDPATGQTIATYGNQTFNFTADANMFGNFYAGYRVAVDDVPGANVGNAAPARFVQFTAVGIAGDFNNDGKVDAGDYATWRKNSSNASLPNDNGLATQAARYGLWRANFGKPSGAGAGGVSGATVPEPTAIGLAGLGILAVLAGRRRNKR